MFTPSVVYTCSLIVIRTGYRTRLFIVVGCNHQDYSNCYYLHPMSTVLVCKLHSLSMLIDFNFWITQSKKTRPNNVGTWYQTAALAMPCAVFEILYGPQDDVNFKFYRFPLTSNLFLEGGSHQPLVGLLVGLLTLPTLGWIRSCYWIISWWVLSLPLNIWLITTAV